jgi:hypothetical protein
MRYCLVEEVAALLRLTDLDMTLQVCAKMEMRSLVYVGSSSQTFRFNLSSPFSRLKKTVQSNTDTSVRDENFIAMKI